MNHFKLVLLSLSVLLNACNSSFPEKVITDQQKDKQIKLDETHQNTSENIASKTYKIIGE